MKKYRLVYRRRDTKDSKVVYYDTYIEQPLCCAILYDTNTDWGQLHEFVPGEGWKIIYTLEMDARDIDDYTGETLYE